MTDKDVDGAHLRILIEQAEDRIERLRTAQEMAERTKRLSPSRSGLHPPEKRA